jgi:F0F1-type ATP synthase assembly protein I
MSHGIELVGAVLVFFFAGFGLDRWLGTGPLFTVILTVLGVIGAVARTWYSYTDSMKRLQAERQTLVATPTQFDREQRVS